MALRSRMKFFDSAFRLRITKRIGTPIWQIEPGFLRWMLDVAREGMTPLEVSIVKAFLEEHARLAQKVKDKKTPNTDDYHPMQAQFLDNLDLTGERAMEERTSRAAPFVKSEGPQPIITAKKLGMTYGEDL